MAQEGGTVALFVHSVTCGGPQVRNCNKAGVR